MTNNESEILIYQTEEGDTRIEVQLEGETVWLTQDQMAELFQRNKLTISRHINNVFEEGELSPKATVAKYATVQNEGGRKANRDLTYYNLDVIISVGYRGKSYRGTQFRIWAAQQLKEYIIKGFILDDRRFKSGKQLNYFDEPLIHNQLFYLVRQNKTNNLSFQAL